MKEKKNISSIKHTFYFLKLAFKFTPGLVIFNFIQSVLFNYLSWTLYTLIFTVQLFKMFEENAPFEKVIWLVSIFAVYFLISSIISNWFYTYYRPVKVEELNYKFLKMLLNKVADVDISCYENVTFFNTYVAALKETESRAINILDSICSFFGALTSVSVFIGTVAALDAVCLIFIILPVILSFVSQFIGMRVRYNFQLEKIPFERKRDYIQRTVLLKKYAKDLRTSNLFGLFKQIYNEGLDGIASVIDKYKHKLYIRNTITQTIGLPLSFYPGWLYAAYKIMVAQTLAMSDYVLIATAIVSGRNLLQSFFDRVNNLIEHGLYVQNFKKMIEYVPQIDRNQDGLTPSAIPRELKFNNVSFTYDGQTKPVLKNLNFSIDLNSTIALLGHNGAGKSTLVKLIMRLYDVSEGEILLDGINIKKYNLKEYQKLITTVFQQPQLFALPIRDNITMGNAGFDTTDENIVRRITDALNNSGLSGKISNLDGGIDSVVTKEFDDKGVEFSGGEYQKLAIARAMFKDSPVIILDEPSSALDPIAEYEMYENIKNLYTGKKNKIVVLISHRMSCALLADNVILLEDGGIIESGNHDELIRKNGKYKEMFEKQKHSYETNSEAHSEAGGDYGKEAV